MGNVIRGQATVLRPGPRQRRGGSSQRTGVALLRVSGEGKECGFGRDPKPTLKTRLREAATGAVLGSLERPVLVDRDLVPESDTAFMCAFARMAQFKDTHEHRIAEPFPSVYRTRS